MRHFYTSALTAALLFVLPAVALGASPLVELRVEGPSETLDSGTWYVTGTERIKRGKNDDCKPRAGRERFPGRTALSVLGSAQNSNRALRPIRVRNTDFGPQVCQVGTLTSFGHYPNASGGFLYWVDNVSGFSSADVAAVKDGQSVLWYHATFPSDPPLPGEPSINTGKALELKGVPAQDADGEFVARVVVHDFDGTPSPVTDAVIDGPTTVTPLGDGRYEIVVGRGKTTLRATRGEDVASNQFEVCSKAKLRKCPKAHGRTIVGSAKRDVLAGTRGFDDITAGAGNDVVNLRSGGRDKVNCGPGRDIVRLKKGDRDDRIASNCERIRRS